MSKLLIVPAVLALALAAAPAFAAAPVKPAAHRAHGGYAVEEKSIAQLQADLTAGRVTSEALVRAYLARIEKLDRNGPKLQAVLALNPDALADARKLDAERRAGHVRGPLHGIPVLIKDNIETADPTATTAGSLALKDNVGHRDSPLVARLRAAGAIILGKTNLSEWANIRSSRSSSGWSAVGGLTRNPYSADRSACGSSSGSGAAAASSFAAAAVGTETDGSISCPSAMNGLVGIKPSVGLIPRTFIVPISHSQDTPGPMARSVADAAAMLTVMAGSDARDPQTADADAHKGDYTQALDPNALKGKRIGVMRFDAGYDPNVDALLDRAIGDLKAAGAEVVEIKEFKAENDIGKSEGLVLNTELKADLATYLASAPAAVKSRTLSDLIAFDNAHAHEEMPFFGQETFEAADKTKGLDDPDYKKARETSYRLAGSEGIDKMLADDKLDALIAPTTGPAWTIDVVNADHFSGSDTTLPAVAGYPHLTVPMGLIDGLPVGLSFIGPKWSEARLIGLGYAYEQRTHRRRPPTYAKTSDQLVDVAPSLKPAK
ncbi:MAG TPA: amidase [Caulobacteraceae bacterium]|jgi:amidase